ncbi:threonine/serine exporter ThrE family protein [uncultured Deefgea sp.]|uniref:threonine/serine ThrE exporter family protein n=1 Tax=uncultured Deefgea sp. TaxID=1304914 RepID=UPI002635114A|nr:threonine/serine exporter family protein [uncultured Deefgea sp.]
MMDTMKPSQSLATILTIALQAGLLAHQSGAGTHRTSLIIQRTAKALGAARVEVIISSTNIGATIEWGSERETGFRKAPHMGANFALLTTLNQWLCAVEQGEANPELAQQALDEMAQKPVLYPRWLIIILVGLSCGSFAALFGGDSAAIMITTLGATLGMMVRFYCVLHHFKPSVFATAASFVALLCTGLLSHWTQTPEAALAASVLFLIPGVPLINGAADLLNANYLNGMVRFAMSGVIVLGIAIGVSLALRILGI